MIDPKFDKIPVEPEDLKAPLTVEERQVRARAAQAHGLSINDTIAHDANVSVGARGVDTSGVRAGTSAPQEPTFVTADEDE